jgi:hypothetical protein
MSLLFSDYLCSLSVLMLGSKSYRDNATLEGRGCAMLAAMATNEGKGSNTAILVALIAATASILVALIPYLMFPHHHMKRNKGFRPTPV